MSRKYELMYVLSPALDEEALAQTNARIQDLITSSATLEKVDEWGKKTLAYEIDYQREGFYYLVTFDSGAEFPSELERVLRITEGVLRYLVVKAVS